MSMTCERAASNSPEEKPFVIQKIVNLCHRPFLVGGVHSLQVQ
jgi:hypothetical protein